MATPTPSDPLGQRPDPASFAESMEAMIDARIDQRWRGFTGKQFANTPDAQLALELIARGWAVFRPTSQDKT